MVGCDERSKVTLYCDEQKRGELEEWIAAIEERTAVGVREEVKRGGREEGRRGQLWV